MEEVLARHRKEQEDLQSQITQKKKSATKKSRKGVNDECARLEQELKANQEQEIAALSGAASADHGDGHDGIDQDDILDLIAGREDKSIEQKTQDLSISKSSNDDAAEAIEDEHDLQPLHRKPNRQKARLARRAAEQEAIAAAAAQEAAEMPDLKQAERERMLAEFAKRGLHEKEVAANGHCMYSAMADQMRQLGLVLDVASDDREAKNTSAASSGQADDYKAVRLAAASYISNHQEDFAPFLEEPMEEYLRKIRDTGEWGGQLELLALAKTYSVNINVLQGEGRLETIDTGENEPRGEAWLAYYRHGFGLGEHYNSLRKTTNTAENG